jgi:hypothetical protein
MKKLYKPLLFITALFTVLLVNGCDPFDDVYLTLAMDAEFSTVGAGSDIFIQTNMCLSDFDDYEDNKDNLEEIRYVTAAYMTINSTQGLQGNNLTLTLYEGNGTTMIFRYVVPTFVASNYINNPLKINLTQQEIDNLNLYLRNPQEDKCFVATLQVSNVTASATPYSMQSKLEFLTELKIKP